MQYLFGCAFVQRLVCFHFVSVKEATHGEELNRFKFLGACRWKIVEESDDLPVLQQQPLQLVNGNGANGYGTGGVGRGTG